MSHLEKFKSDDIPTGRHLLSPPYSADVVRKSGDVMMPFDNKCLNL